LAMRSSNVGTFGFSLRKNMETLLYSAARV
jgi:hypothetical protein